MKQVPATPPARSFLTSREQIISLERSVAARDELIARLRAENAELRKAA